METTKVTKWHTQGMNMLRRKALGEYLTPSQDFFEAHQ